MELMLIIFFISLVILITGALHKKMKDFYLTEPLIALLAGIVLGPHKQEKGYSRVKISGVLYAAYRPFPCDDK